MAPDASGCSERHSSPGRRDDAATVCLVPWIGAEVCSVANSQHSTGGKKSVRTAAHCPHFVSAADFERSMATRTDDQKCSSRNRGDSAANGMSKITGRNVTSNHTLRKNSCMLQAIRPPAGLSGAFLPSVEDSAVMYERIEIQMLPMPNPLDTNATRRHVRVRRTPPLAVSASLAL
mmetsp:Transcript_30794/g.56138  ORF Transcript_30794/g.56138 Transcript_30794/m.56138 type:complete len:176 (-) Transcript_30794:86-613(-)